MVLLHSAVTDRRSWHGVLDALAGEDLDLIAYDRRGFGDTSAGNEPFTHLGDLVDVLDEVGAERALLVGNSMGGGLALDLAVTAPDRVAGLVLLGTAVSGMTDEGEDAPYEPDPATAAILGAIERAERDGDVAEQVRLGLHLWLDGPGQREGRVGGPLRSLAADMHRRILAARVPEQAGASGLDTWVRLGSIEVPVLAAWGDLDVPADLPWYERIAARLPRATGRVLPGVAHLPSLERPDLVAGLVHEALASWR